MLRNLSFRATLSSGILQQFCRASASKCVGSLFTSPLSALILRSRRDPGWGLRIGKHVEVQPEPRALDGTHRPTAESLVASATCSTPGRRGRPERRADRRLMDLGMQHVARWLASPVLVEHLRKATLHGRLALA